MSFSIKTKWKLKVLENKACAVIKEELEEVGDDVDSRDNKSIKTPKKSINEKHKILLLIIAKGWV